MVLCIDREKAERRAIWQLNSSYFYYLLCSMDFSRSLKQRSYRRGK